MDRRQILALAFGLAGCSGGQRVRVGSKNFTEQLILGELLALQVERRTGREAARRLNLGGTLVATKALQSGSLDLYPEYTGTALSAVLKEDLTGDAGAILARVRQAYREQYAIEWLDPLGIDNTFAMVVRGEDARKLGLKTLSDAARVKNFWKLGAGYEFQERRDGLPALAPYAIAWASPVRTMDLGLLYTALEQRQVNIAAGSATDGLLAARDFVVLEDDRRVFPAYEACVAVRQDAMAANPGLREALSALSGKLSNQAMRRLNLEVDGRHRDPAQVAREFADSL